MQKIVQQTIAKEHMFSQSASVLVALSGGADSVALLLCLQALQYTVSAAHLHHGLRGQEADRDCAFVQQLCAERGIACYTDHVDVQAHAERHGLSVETAARHLRYDFLQRVAQEIGATHIATAHTASDNVETVLHHVIRGTGTRGLAGIPPVRDNIVRPLLAVTRAQVEAYLQEQGQSYAIDSSNHSLEYTRNRIRQTVVPPLLAIAPNAEQAVARMCELVRRDCDCIDLWAEQEAQMLCHRDENRITVQQTALRTQHPAVASRVLSAMLTQMGVPAQATTASHFSSLLRLVDKSGSCDLPQGFRAWSEGGVLAIETRYELPNLPVSLENPCPLWHTGCILTINPRKIQIDFNKPFNTFWVDCDTIDIGTLHVRAVQPQDRLQLEGTRGARQLKRLMDDYRIPRAKRAVLAVLADKNGIVAVQDMGICQAHSPMHENVYEIIFTR